MANGQKSLAILNGLLSGGPVGAVTAGVAVSEGGDDVANTFNEEVALRSVPASAAPVATTSNAGLLVSATPESVVPTSIFSTSVSPTGQTTFAGIPLTYLFAGVIGMVLLIVAVEK